MCCLQNKDNTVKKTFKGETCNIDLLDFLPDNSVIYFHNLAYDIRMLAQYGMNKSIIKGSKVMKADIKFECKTIHFRDSYPMISSKLSDFPAMFNLPKVRKEIFPYKYYTLERLKKNRGIISEAGQNEDKAWTNADYDLFKSNIDKIPGCRLSDTKFDMWKYATFTVSRM